MKKTFRRGYLVNTAVLIAVYALCVALSVVLADSGSFRLTVVPSIWQCCYLIILAASLNLVLGFMGQLSLGHCGFMAIGAYTAALISLAFQRAGVYDEKSGIVFVLILFCASSAQAFSLPCSACWLVFRHCASRATTSPS